jgi:DNA invertase Pin-like site-specific DNA recombinase
MSTAENACAELEPWIAGKIESQHRQRLAMVYVRQSTVQQVLENRESADLQYALRRRAVEWGWPPDRVVVIDQDQGHSGRSAEGREGFQHLLAEISLDHVGIVLGAEMSRLARSCRDWYQLLEVCALFGVLLADREGLYDPRQYNDRLLLGLKGTISEAELHLIRQRMHQGTLNKARRGELYNHLPLGYVLEPGGELQMDADEQAQATVRLVFSKFEQIGSINGLLRYLVEHRVLMPVRSQLKANSGELEWHRPNRTTLAYMLHHPVYAGAYCWGRRTNAGPGKASQSPAVSAGQGILIRDRCPSYITWEQYQANLERMQQNRSRWDRRGPIRGGGALLAGLVICGRCGCRLLVSYPDRKHPRYTCVRRRITYGEETCQAFAGQSLEKLVEQQVLRALEPASLELSLAAAEDLRREQELADERWRHRLERAQQASDRAARQFHAVEPENRLVARELERRWEAALAQQQDLKEQHERSRARRPAELTDSERRQIRELARDIPALWRSPQCTATDRQEIIRHLIEQVVVNGSAVSPVLDVSIYFVGGFVSRHELRRPMSRWDQMPEWPKLQARVVELSDGNRTAGQIAEQLNRDGFHPPKCRSAFNAPMVQSLLARQSLCVKRPTCMQANILVPNEWWLSDLARKLDVSQATLHNWVRRGWAHARQLKGLQGRWILWADHDELIRLGRLRSDARGWYNQPQSPELTTPKPRTDQP